MSVWVLDEDGNAINLDHIECLYRRGRNVMAKPAFRESDFSTYILRQCESQEEAKTVIQTILSNDRYPAITKINVMQPHRGLRV